MEFSVLMAIHENDDVDFLRQALASLRSQTLAPAELVVVEDGPLNCGLIRVLDQYRKALKIVSIKLPVNHGLAVALNQGLRACKYHLVARMDADDIALPDRFEKQVSWMIKNPGVSASSGVVEEIDYEGNSLSMRFLPLANEDLLRFARRRSPLSHPAVIFRREAVMSVGGYPSFRKGQDYALWSLMLNNGHKLANIPDVLVKMRAGRAMMRRRGLTFLRHEISLLNYQRRIGFLRFYDYVFNLSGRIVLRILPGLFRGWLYKFMR